MDDVEKINAIKDRIITPRNNKGIYFGRVPRKEWEWFTQWCDEEFESDWGMGLKWLCQGYMPPENIVIFEELEGMKVKIQELESQIVNLKIVSSEKKTIKLLGGKEIGKGE